MTKDNPITGPYPDGDSRNVTLTKSDNPFEPERTGPKEHAFRDEGGDTSVQDKDTADGDAANGNERVERYREPSPQPSAAETAFGRPGGALKEPVLQKDWNPAERNSDDLSR